MKKVILLAGYPATGKTYMSNIIREEHPIAMYLSQDEVKEMMYDMVGFSNLIEKNELIEFAREVFYDIVKMSLLRNEILLLDYPFSDKQMDFLKSLSNENDVEFMTVRLIADLDVLYERRVKRDLASTRNKGHILEKYHGYESYTQSTYPLSRSEYKQNCIKGKYAQFEFGKLIEIDVTVYEQIDYNSINKKVNEFLE